MGNRPRHGFYVNRFVEAADESAAIEAAIETLRARPDIWAQYERRRPHEGPQIGVDEIYEIEGESPSEQGFIWFPMTDS